MTSVPVTHAMKIFGRLQSMLALCVLMHCLPGIAVAATVPVGGVALTDRFCKAPITRPPVERKVAGCTKALCTAVGKEQLCLCDVKDPPKPSKQGTDDDDREPIEFRFQRYSGGKLIQSWPAEVSPMLGLSVFGVTITDLDGDGQPEWVVAHLLAVSNGLGIAYSNVYVVSPGHPERAPLMTPLQEWGSLTLLIQESGRKTCSLMDSMWQGGSESQRGSGLYGVGRLSRYVNGQWQAVPFSDRAPVARRLLFGFQNQREQRGGMNRNGLWYQNPRTFSVQCPDEMCERPKDE